MRRHRLMVDVLGPWSLVTSRAFWEGFTPSALRTEADVGELRAVFLSEHDWSRAEAIVIQRDGSAEITMAGDGDLHAAAAQVCTFLSLDIDARAWPDVGEHDPVIARAQQRLPGLRPCGFHSPYEAAAWAVLSQRVRIVQAARLREEVIARHGDAGAFPPPHLLRTLDLDVPGRKAEYLHAVADAALDGRLDSTALRAMDPEDAIHAVQQIKGIGPSSAELVVIRGANAPDAVPHHESRLDQEITVQYGPHRTLQDVSPMWRPYRTWAAVHLRTLREQRTHEINGPPRRGTAQGDRGE